MSKTRLLLLLAAAVLLPSVAGAETLSIEIQPPRPPGPEHFMGKGPGSASAPDAAASKRYGTIGYDNDSLLRDSRPFIPVMGEFHYSRVPRAEWRDELLKMKAGGISIISTYIFWIHHEEIQGQFDWQGEGGQKDLHAFLQLCGELELPVLVRIGPWCHGEVRNGGHPDWVEALPRKRRDDPQYMAAVRPYYEQITAQMKGLLWKDGGPVIGIQLENETPDGPYLVKLKNLARDDGLDVPLYTKTGWPALRQPVPFGELLPFFGSYAEGFWDRNLLAMPQDKYWQAFTFSAERIDTAIGSDIFGTPAAGSHVDESGVISYPFLTCENGAGMISSYHRRILMSTMDSYALALCKIGAGCNLPGYYLYHGGTNPDSKTGIALSESQATGMWNDMPNKTYDWDGPIGEFGQVRESYHVFRRLHLFLHDYGDALARMPVTFPASGPIKQKTDDQTVRWTVRSDGKSGFLFVNNYQRGLDMPDKKDVQFSISFPNQTPFQFPPASPTDATVAIPANSAFFWPFNLDLGGATLVTATAQPICKLQDGTTTYSIFAETPGVQACFEFMKDFQIDTTTGQASQGEARNWVRAAARNGAPIITGHTADGRKQVLLLLDEPHSLIVWKAALAGKDHLFFSRNDLTFSGKALTISRTNGPLAVSVLPPLDSPGSALSPVTARTVLGIQQLTFTEPTAARYVATVHPQQASGPPREIKMGSQKVAEQPSDADFAGPQPAVFKITLPAAATDPHAGKILLRLHYAGDVARLYLGDKLIEDNFYNGLPMDYGLWRLPANTTELTLKILPLQKNAPIMLPQWPEMHGRDALAELSQTELVRTESVTLEAH